MTTEQHQCMNAGKKNMNCRMDAMGKQSNENTNKITELILENEPVANKVIARVLFVMAGIYCLVGTLTVTNIFKSNEWVKYGLFFFACILLLMAVFCLKVNCSSSWIKYAQLFLLQSSLFATNIVIGYRAWMIFVVPIFLSVRFYNRRFTNTLAGISIILIITSAFTNAYFAPYLGIVDLNLVSFKEPGTLEYYSWLFNAVITHGYDRHQLVINSLKLSVFPNCLSIIVAALIGNSIISHVEGMLVKISDSYEKEINLLRESHTDQITGILNRRAYEENLEEISRKELDSGLVYFSVDLNELKRVNDSLGHVAGDEIIIATSEILNKVLGTFGNIYRIGGDEFAAVISADEKQLEALVDELERSVKQWHGELVDSLTISYGYVTKKDVDDSFTIYSIANLADKRMYEMKAEYYRINGIDRRRR